LLFILPVNVKSNNVVSKRLLVEPGQVAILNLELESAILDLKPETTILVFLPLFLN